jgi:small ligand-binding sensory domain FIST
LAQRPVGVHLAALETGDGWVIDGLDPAAARAAATFVLLVDPYSFPIGAYLDDLGRRYPHLSVIGGLASAARGPGGNRLVLDGRVHLDGAVGVLLPASPDLVVSQGCRPIGQPLIVTKAERNRLHELAGRPALDRLLEVIEQLTPEDRALAARGLHCGIVIDEGKLDFAPGDFLIRGVLGADRDAGAVAVGEEVSVGSTVQFQVRDGASADDDLHRLLHGRSAEGVLVFTCTGRGRHLFGTPDHDAGLVSALLDARAVGGMFCAGEIGPVAGRNYLHGFTASMALFRE